MLDNRRVTRKIVAQQGLSLEPPLVISAHNCIQSFPTTANNLSRSSPSNPSLSSHFPSAPQSSPLPPVNLQHCSSPNSPVSRSSSSTCSSLNEILPHALLHQVTMSSSGIATVALHPGHKVAPVLSDGVTTPGALLDWENACEDFFASSKEPIPDDKKVSKVTGGLQNPRISLYVRNNCARLHMLAFTDFMSKLHETFLPKDWAKDTLRKILVARMTLDQSFDNFCTEIITSNNLLDGMPLHLSEPRMKEQIYNNITEDLWDKLEDNETKLAALNKLTFQKWLNAISEVDIKMAKAIRRSMKCIALELEKEEKKKRNLSGPSRNANTSSTGSTANQRTYTQNNYNKPRNYLPALMEEERALLYENRGCYKCRRLYAEHLGCNCPNDFPDTHILITPALAATAKAEWEKRRQSKGKLVNRGPAASSSTPAVATIVEESSEVSGDENDMEEEENSRVIAMTWPSAVALGDSDSDDSVSPPLKVPNLYWNANTLGRDGFFVPIKAMLDNGAHIVLIRPDAVDMLGLVRK